MVPKISEIYLPNRKTRLNQPSVDRATAQSSEYIIWDNLARGFGLRVRPSGRKTFFVKVRLRDANRTQKKITIGTHPSVTCSAARRRALDLIAGAQMGVDLGPAKKSTEKPVTIAVFWEKFEQNHVRKNLKSRSAEETRSLANRFILPKLGDLKIEDLNEAHAIALHRQLCSTPFQANRALGLLSKMFSDAVTWGITRDRPNPCRAVKRYPEPARDRFLTDIEITRLTAALDQHEAKSAHFVNAVRLLLFTGMRKNEVVTLRWSEVDLDHGFIRLSDSKTGPRNIPINSQTKIVLAKQKALANGHFVFPAQTPNSKTPHITGLQKAWERIRADAMLHDVRIHDLRHTFASIAASKGVSLHKIGALLGHQQVSTTMRYAHLADETMTHSAGIVGDAIVSLQETYKGVKEGF